MNIGLAGLPMSGKTTVFNMATKAQAEIRDYLSQSEQVNKGVVKVPDDRLEYLAAIFKPKRVVHATVEFVDIPGVSKGTTNSSGISTKFLANIRTCDAVCIVVRLFEDQDVPHIYNRIDPQADLQEVLLEFVLADLQTVSNKIERIMRDLKGGRKPDLVKELELMEKMRQHLESEKLLSEFSIDTEQKKIVQNFGFLTLKPILVVGNCSETQLRNKEDRLVKSFFEFCEKKGWKGILVAAKTEMEIASLPPEEEQEFLREFGITEPGRNVLIKEAYRILDYISFLTAGETEVRAWPIQKGTSALHAAGKIHSDIERGFIRAEVVNFKDFQEKGSMAAVKQAGLLRLEGKEYIMQDGDIVLFRFNV